MGSILTRVHEVLSSCFSPKSSTHGADEMTTIAGLAPGIDNIQKADQLSSPVAPTDVDDNDNLLVEKGQRRTLRFRRQLADDDEQPYREGSMAHAPLFHLSDTEFIQELHDAFKPELEDLCKADAVTVELGSGKVKGGYGVNGNLSPSEMLFGHFYSEVDRTIVGLLAMKWIVADCYGQFTAHQSPAVKLTEKSFKEMREIFLAAFGDSYGSYMLIVSMIINDLGKTTKMRKYIQKEQPKRWNVMNHDEVIYWMAKYDKLRLINEFDGEQRNKLMKGIELGMKLNLGQLAQGECVPGNLEGIGDLMGDDPSAFPMKFCEIVLDVAGAAGHIDSRAANAWIQPVNDAYKISRKCVMDVIGDRNGEPPVTPREAYDAILDGRAQLLATEGFRRLDVRIAEHRALLRLMTMARAANKTAAQGVEDAFNLLSLSPKPNGRIVKDFFGHPIKNVKDALVNGLMVDGINDGVAIIPYYGPGLLAEAARVTKASTPELRTRAMAAVLRFFARVFIGTKPLPGKPGFVIDCDLSFIKEDIRSPQFLDNPDILDSIEYPTDPDLDPYGKPQEESPRHVEELMKEIYSIRRIGRRRPLNLQQQQI